MTTVREPDKQRSRQTSKQIGSQTYRQAGR